MIHALLLGMCLLGTGPAGQDTPSFPKTPITVEIRGKLIPQAFEELSKLGGVRLSATPIVAREPLILRVKGKPFDEVMERIARVMDAEWRIEEGEYRLVRTASVVAKVESERIEREAKKLEPMLQEFRNALAKEPSLDLASAAQLKTRMSNLVTALRNSPTGQGLSWAQVDDLKRTTPVSRFVHSVLCSIDPKVFVAVRPESRVVFSTAPNRLQRALPTEAMKAWRSYQTEYPLWLDAITDMEDLLLESAYRGLDLPFPAANEVDRMPAKALFTVERHDQYNPGQFRFLVANASGEVLGHWERMLIETHVSGFNFAARDLLAGKTTVPISLSPMTEQIVDHYRKIRSQPPGSYSNAFSKDLLDLLLNPHRRDPSELMMSDFVFGAADQNGANVVAAPGFTGGLLPGLLVARTPMSVEAFWLHMGTKWMGVQGQKEDDWIMLKPVVPFAEYRAGADRALLAKYLKPFEEQGVLALQDLADFAAPHESSSGLAHMSTFGLLFSRTVGGSGGDTNPAILRLHGLLTSEQRSTLERGVALRIRELGPWIVELLRKVVFEHNARLQERKPDSPKYSPDPWPGGVSHIRVEATESFPLGLPPNAALRLEGKSDASIYATLTQGRTGVRSMDPKGVGREIAGPRFPDPEHNLDLGPNGSRFIVERLKVYKYFIELGNGLYVSGELQDSIETTPWVDSWEKLPADIVEQIRAEVQKIKDSKPPPNSRANLKTPIRS